MARKKKDESRIESYDDDKGEVQLKDGNREGLSAIVRITEDVKVEQDHDANLESIDFTGKLGIENPSTIDRLWDIAITFKDVENVNLKSNEINIQELGITEEDNTDSKDFKISGEAQNLLLVKEFINTLPNSDDILNSRDIESAMLKLRENVKGSDEDVEEDEDEEADGGGAEAGIESYGISINKTNTVGFSIAMYSLFEKDISEVSVVKNIPSGFENINIDRPSIGSANLEGDQIMWSMDSLEPETNAILKFTADILVETKDSVKTGTIEVNYKAASSFTGGLEIEKSEGFTNNKYHVDIIERDEEPGVWDCNLVFENPSEFSVELFKADVYDPEDTGTKFVSIDEENPPLLPAGAQWHSKTWQYESDDYPSFRKELEFRIFSELETDVNASIVISDIELMLASITGEVTIEEPDIAIPTEEEGVIALPSYKDADIPTTLKYVNDGSAPLNEVKLTQKGFDDKFRPPQPDEIEAFIDGKPIDLAPEDIIVDDDSVQIVLPDLKDRPTGMLEPDSVLEVKFPIHAENPPEDTEFVTDVIYNGNTYPIGPELEYIPTPEEIPVIKIIHVRRKYRLGKKIIPIGELGHYEIIIEYENLGNMPLKDYTILDKVPDNFEYGEFSLEPDITDEKGSDTLKWVIEELAEEERIEISYKINGSGEYKASDCQLLH